ncbi:MAG: hypothetical protein II755_00365, partial [Prevotella sp.]|nr:hypothetical protein [Prevotella sp.]
VAAGSHRLRHHIEGMGENGKFFNSQIRDKKVGNFNDLFRPTVENGLKTRMFDTRPLALGRKCTYGQ